MSSANSSNASLSVLNIKAPKNGYAFVYVSNESDEMVYFDNFQVSHTRGRIIEENHYYAYGLRISGISSRKLGDANEGMLKNQYQYQGAYSEYDDELAWNGFGLRDYDPQIGRFIQSDPFNQFSSQYTGMGNDPVNVTDPSGGLAIDFGTINTLGRIGVAAAGALIGYAADRLSGGKGWKGAIIGGGLALGATFIPPFDIGKVAGILAGAGATISIVTSVAQNPLVQEAINPVASFAGNNLNTEQQPYNEYDLGPAGNTIRSYAGSNFSKELFSNYWLGKGVYYMRFSTFQQVAQFIEKSGSSYKKQEIELSGKKYFVAVHNFYGSSIFDKALGRATVIFNLDGKPVGLYDQYDFDIKKWGERSWPSETKTRLVYLASRFGTNAMPFAIFYGKGAEYFWKYIAPEIYKTTKQQFRVQ